MRGNLRLPIELFDQRVDDVGTPPCRDDNRRPARRSLDRRDILRLDQNTARLDLGWLKLKHASSTQTGAGRRQWLSVGRAEKKRRSGATGLGVSRYRHTNLNISAIGSTNDRLRHPVVQASCQRGCMEMKQPALRVRAAVGRSDIHRSLTINAGHLFGPDRADETSANYSSSSSSSSSSSAG